jgi:hypothetical protein
MWVARSSTELLIANGSAETSRPFADESSKPLLADEASL